MENKTPEPGSSTWRKNETTINNNPVLKQARDISQGLEKPAHKYRGTGAGKGSSQRPTNKADFDAGWDRIWGNKS